MTTSCAFIHAQTWGELLSLAGGAYTVLSVLYACFIYPWLERGKS